MLNKDKEKNREIVNDNSANYEELADRSEHVTVAEPNVVENKGAVEQSEEMYKNSTSVNTKENNDTSKNANDFEIIDKQK
jgi:hypothetical protein